jgi:hypothetical protein
MGGITGVNQCGVFIIHQQKVVRRQPATLKKIKPGWMRDGVHPVILNRYGFGLCLKHIDNSSTELHHCGRTHLTDTTQTRSIELAARMDAAMEKGAQKQG